MRLRSLLKILIRYKNNKYLDDFLTNFKLILKDYEADNVSKKILRIILSYTDYINRTVWHKDI